MTSVAPFSIWQRLLYMLVYGLFAGFIRMLIWLFILLQLLVVLFFGKTNPMLLNASRRLSAYLYHMLLFLTFNTDDLAFPFASWQLTNHPELIVPRASE